MARLQKGERKDKENMLYRLLRRLRWGVRESEIAEELGWQRRTVNNYLRQLKNAEKAHQEGRSWFSE
jgi:DNA-binding NarL/FixJ family response regulator